MTPPPRLRGLHGLRQRAHRAASDTALMIRVGIPHDRYTVAFHTDTAQMWVIDTTDHDRPQGPFLSSRQAWQIAEELNTAHH